MNHDWYKHFFSGLSVDLWCNAVPPEQTADEVRFLLRVLDLPEQARVLDSPCGSGRHSIGMAREGYRVTAVDLSEEFLAVARASAQEAGVRIDFRHADMNELDWHEEFDAVVCLGNSFGYADQPTTEGFVRRIAGALKPGGRFALQSGVMAESILPNMKPEFGCEFGGIDMQVRNRYCVRHSRLDTDYVFTQGDRVERGTSWHWSYTTQQVCRMLSSVGLEIIGFYRSLDLEPFEVGSPYLHLVAEKWRSA
jgi:SAM-dependent methyltransferase